MAGDEDAEGSQSRRPPGSLDAALDCPVSFPNLDRPAPVVPRTDEHVALLTPVPAYSPSNALSTPDEQSMLDSFDYSWLDDRNIDGEESTEALDVTDSSLLSSRMAPGLEEYEGLTPWMERLVRPGRLTGGVEMVSTASLLSQSIEGAVDIEARTPELRLQRMIRISQQHSIVRSGLANRAQRASSPEADSLSWAIQRSHDSIEMARRKKLEGDNSVGGNASVSKDGCCGCNSSFECSICLDSAKEPVVTPCGHLFCWPCLYQWLHVYSVHSECPVCKGEVLEVNVTPIYVRGGGQRDASRLDMPPRPCANRTQSLRQQLQAADAREIATVVRQLIENQGIVRGQPNPVEAAVPTGRSRARARRQQRQDSISAIMLNTGNVAPENSNQVPLPPSDDGNTTHAGLVAPEQSSSLEQTSTSSTAAVRLREPRSSRRSRPSEPPTTRRTRRRQP